MIAKNKEPINDLVTILHQRKLQPSDGRIIVDACKNLGYYYEDTKSINNNGFRYK